MVKATIFLSILLVGLSRGATAEEIPPHERLNLNLVPNWPTWIGESFAGSGKAGEKTLTAGQLPQEVAFFIRAENFLRKEAFGFSESRLGSYLDILRTNEESIYSLLRQHPNVEGIKRLAMAVVLLRKGRSVDEIAAVSRAIHRSLGPHEQELFDCLQALRREYIDRSLAGPDQLSARAYQESLDRLQTEADTVEAELAKRSASLRLLWQLPSPEKIVAEVAATLPPDGALIEIVALQTPVAAAVTPQQAALKFAQRFGFQYVPIIIKPRLDSPFQRYSYSYYFGAEVYPFNVKRVSMVKYQLQYMAFVLLPQGAIKVNSLGSAMQIDHLVSRFLRVLSDPSSSYLPIAQELFRKILNPILPFLGQQRNLFISTDGQLNFVPFAALHDGVRFGLDRFSWTYLTSGRDLLRYKEEPPNSSSTAGSIVLFADPDFESAPDISSSTVPSASPGPTCHYQQFISEAGRFGQEKSPAALQTDAATDTRSSRSHLSRINLLGKYADLFKLSPSDISTTTETQSNTSPPTTTAEPPRQRLALSPSGPIPHWTAGREEDLIQSVLSGRLHVSTSPSLDPLVAFKGNSDTAHPPPRAEMSGPSGPTLALADHSPLRGLSTDLRGQRFWPPLPGTRKEAEAIHKLFPQARLLLGRSATKAALLNLSAPSIVHIATHGFFFESTLPSSTPRRAVGEVGELSEPPIPPAHPLLRSALVLAGAHAKYSNKQFSEDWEAPEGLATALEISGINLWGTQMVVLSACNTGRGAVRLGQGVYGLRRALTIAGAETVVTSLWPVGDATTSHLMVPYYQHLLEGAGRVEAMQRAMVEMRKEHPHPYYWAPFIVLGNGAPLRGLESLRTAHRK